MRPSPNTRLGMATLLARNWWTLALRGILALVFGLAVFVWPTITLRVLVRLFAVFAFVGGIFALSAALRDRRTNTPWWVLLLEGIFGIIAGLLVFFWPAITGLILLYLIAAWALVSGVFELILAIQLRKQIENEWLLAAAGLASLLLGLFLAIWPVTSVLAILWLIGAYAIIFGVILLILAFRLRNWNQQQPPTTL